jgi:dimeric dUTPase (all-alpha-NTP-PPase superfamily)
MVQIAFPDLETLAGYQQKLDERIIKKFNITEDVSNRLVIAFKVEFGEFLNEHKFFKFWKEDRTPNTGGTNPLLEEYVDGIHFLLSIGIKRNYLKYMHAFHAIECDTESLEALAMLIFNNPINSAGKWLECFNHYLYFGHCVGISAEDIMQAYILKNKINHDRQDQGY